MTLELMEDNGEHQPGVETWYRCKSDDDGVTLSLSSRVGDPLYQQFRETFVGQSFVLFKE